MSEEPPRSINTSYESTVDIQTAVVPKLPDSLRSLCGPSLDELFKVSSRRNSKHESPTSVGNDRKALRLITVDTAIEEGFKLFQGCIHCDDFVDIASSLEFLHGLLNMIHIDDLTIFE